MTMGLDCIYQPFRYHQTTGSGQHSRAHLRFGHQSWRMEESEKNNLLEDIEKIITFIRESNAKVEHSNPANVTVEEEKRMAELLGNVLDDCIEKWDLSRMEETQKTAGLKNICLSKAREKTSIQSSKTTTKLLKIPRQSDVYSNVIVSDFTKHNIVKKIKNYHIHLTLKPRKVFSGE